MLRRLRCLLHGHDWIEWDALNQHPAEFFDGVECRKCGRIVVISTKAI